MKKLFVTMLAVLATGATYALPVGNPSEASLLCDGLFWEGNCDSDPCDPCTNWCNIFSLRVGFYGDYVFNRHLEEPTNGDMEHAEIYTNAGYIALNFWDRVDLFTTLGETNLYVKTNSVFGYLEAETDSNFSWSVGGRVTLWECGCTALGFEGQYFRTNTNIKRITIGGDESLYPAPITGDDRPRYSEWQVGLGISHRINVLVPYIAVKYSRPHWDFNDTTFAISDGVAIAPGNFRSEKHWGYAVGVSLVDCEKAALTVEGRFADEKAVYVNGQIRF